MKTWIIEMPDGWDGMPCNTKCLEYCELLKMLGEKGDKCPLANAKKAVVAIKSHTSYGKKCEALFADTSEIPVGTEFILYAVEKDK